MVTLQNDFLRVTVSDRGAELTSMFNKLNGIEHLWQGDPSIWAFHAPNLFPVVGSCINDEVMVEGKKYPMQRHGFARHSEFILVESSDTHAKFSLEFSEYTLAVYPYKFTFQVLYDLLNSELRVSYKVINQEQKTIYFSLGAHPAFNIPFYKDESYEDYYVEFNKDEKLVKHLFTHAGYFTGRTELVVLEEGSRLNLTKTLFDEGALVFKKLVSREVVIKNHKTPNFVSISFPNFDSLGIWAPPGAPFVCIEPWLGHADSDGELLEIKDKAGIRALEQGHVFEVDFLIGIN